MDYPKSLPNAGLVDGKFVDEDPVAGMPGSLIPADWANALMAELLGVIQAAGMVPDEADRAQLLRAIQTMASSDFKKSVRVATTGPIALSGLQSIDGVQLVAGDRVLVKSQANAAQNWIYVATADAWLRAQDADDSAECGPGHLIVVQSGTQGAGTVWQLSNTEKPVLGTTPLTFRRVFGKTGVVAGSFNKVEVNELGQVIGGSNPTKLSEYGITDGVSKDEHASIEEAAAGESNSKWMSPVRVFQALRASAAQATELLRGVLRIGTQEEVDAGTSDATVVTPKKLKFGFAAMIAPVGYVVFPKFLGGLIIQWGTFTSTSLPAGTGGSATFSLPYACPNAHFGVNATPVRTAPTNGGFACYASALSLSTFSVTWDAANGGEPAGVQSAFIISLGY